MLHKPDNCNDVLRNGPGNQEASDTQVDKHVKLCALLLSSCKSKRDSVTLSSAMDPVS